MGAWDEGIYDNDIAMDMVCDYKEMREESYTVDEVLEQLWNDNLDNEAVLVLADKEYNMYRCLRNNHLKAVQTALRSELDESMLEGWNNPERRKSKLLEFAKKIGFDEQLTYKGGKVHSTEVVGDLFGVNEMLWLCFKKERYGFGPGYAVSITNDEEDTHHCAHKFCFNKNLIEFEAQDIFGNSGNLPCYVFGRGVQLNETWEVPDLFVNCTFAAAQRLYKYIHSELDKGEFEKSIFFLFDASIINEEQKAELNLL